MIKQHKLCCGEIVLALHRTSVAPSFDSLHGSLGCRGQADRLRLDNRRAAGFMKFGTQLLGVVV